MSKTYYVRLNCTGFLDELVTAYTESKVLEARIDELALFAQKLIKEEGNGSTPSDLVLPEPYIEADDDEIIAYVDDRIAQLTQKRGQDNG